MVEKERGGRLDEAGMEGGREKPYLGGFFIRRDLFRSVYKWDGCGEKCDIP